MRYHHCKKIAKKCSVIGFGAWQLGNAEFFGEMSDQEGVYLVHEALKEGVNVFDTAPGYGSGNSERILGIALQEHRDEVFINTKFGHTADGRSDFSVEGLHKSIRASLHRLQTNYLDGLILHNPNRDLLSGKHPLFEALQKYKQEGIVRHYGVSIDSIEELDVVLHSNDVDIIEIMFNIIHQSPKTLFDEIHKKGIMLLIKVPLDSGWLSGKYTKETIFSGVRARWNDEVKATRLEIVKRIKEIIGKDHIAEDALRFILSYGAVTSVIPGVRTVDQLESNVHAQEEKMSRRQVHDLENLYDSYIKHQKTPW